MGKKRPSLVESWRESSPADRMFVVLRFLTVPGVSLWVLLQGTNKLAEYRWVWILLALFAGYSVLTEIAILSRQNLAKLGYSLALTLDMLFMAALVHFTGGIYSNFQLGYFLMVVLSAYYFGALVGLGMAIISVGLTLIVEGALLLPGRWADLGLFLVFEILLALAVGYLTQQAERERGRVERLNEELARRSAQLERAYNEVISSWAAAVDAKDNYTRGHSERVSAYALATAKALGLSDLEQEEIRVAGLLHDVGKIGVPDYVLTKPGKLTSEEWESVYVHPAQGALIVREVGSLSEVAKLIMHHHESLDGRGYPEGLQGDAIPLGSRIIAIADAYDAMTSDRPYRRALTHDEAIDELRRGSGSKYDPKVLPMFLSTVEFRTNRLLVY